MKRLAFLLFFFSPSLFAQEVKRPNLVLLVADDHGLDAGCYGHPVVRTPHLDQLAREGTRYTRAFCTTASCSASRSVLLSGLHNHQNGQYGHQHSFHHFSSFRTVQSLPVVLAKNGYRTGRIGKFHVAPEEVYAFQKVLPTAGGSRNAVAMAEQCKDFISDKSAPFFLYFCSSDPHRGGGKIADQPLSPDLFGNKGNYPGVKETVYDPGKVIVPSWLPDNPATRAELAQYYQAITRLDQGIGRLVEILKAAGQYENTVIVYTSDNGSAMPGSKTTLYEPGMRLPLVVKSPVRQESPGSGDGVTCSAMVSWVDITPTLIDFAGVKEVRAPALIQADPEEKRLPKQTREVPYTFHGRSFKTTLGKTKVPGWDRVFASHTFHEITMYYPMRVIRTERYKLIRNLAHPLPFPFASDLFESAAWQSALQARSEKFGKRKVADFIQRPQVELYDLEKDPDEVVNLAGDPGHKEILQTLSIQLKEFQQKTGDPWIVKYRYE